MEKVKPFVEKQEGEEEEEEVPLHGRKSSRTTTAISVGTNGGVLIGSQYSFSGDQDRELESNVNKNGETENLPAISSLQVLFSAKPHEKRIEYATSDTGTSQNGNGSLIKEIGPDVAEVYLEEVIKKPNTREFYCPLCDTCIQKVMLRDTEEEHTSAQCVELIRYTSCFSFQVPAGTVEVGINKEPSQQSSTTTKPPSSVTELDQNVAPSLSGAAAPENDSASVFEKPPHPAASGGAYLTVTQKPDMYIAAVAEPRSIQPLEQIVIVGGKLSTGSKKEEIAGTSEEETSQHEPGLHISICESWTSEKEISQHEPCVQTIICDSCTSSAESRSDSQFEIVKSIVYGGLIESIASLCVVTSAASAGATPLKIVALALANLIGGLLVMGQNLWELRREEPAETSGIQVDRYHVLLGNRNNFAFHISVAVLSYLVFGLIPPVVYGFSFQKSNNTDFKLLAVAAASFICITILAIGKAHIQRPPSFYFRTVLKYVLIGAMASGISYVAGDLVKKVMEKFGWLKSVAVTTPLPEMDSGTLAWASY